MTAQSPSTAEPTRARTPRIGFHTVECVTGSDHLAVHYVFLDESARRLIRGRRFARLFLLPPMTRHAALAARLPRLFRRPFVRGSLLMRCLAAFAGNFALFASIHRRES